MKKYMHLTPNQVAEMFGITIQTQIKWRKQGILPQPIRRGGRLLYKISDIERVIKESQEVAMGKERVDVKKVKGDLLTKVTEEINAGVKDKPRAVDNRVQFNVRLEPELVDEIKKTAKQDKRSIGRQVEVILEGYINSRNQTQRKRVWH